MKYYCRKTNNGFLKNLRSFYSPLEFVVESPTIPTDAELQLAYVSFMNSRSKKLSTARALELRDKRTELLSASDWTQTVDSPLSKEMQIKWQEYRQALRDLPSSGKMTWPTPPPTK